MQILWVWRRWCFAVLVASAVATSASAAKVGDDFRVVPGRVDLHGLSVVPPHPAGAAGTPTPLPVCTPPACSEGVLVCPDVCPGGCGTICRPFGELPDLVPSSADFVAPQFNGCVNDYSEIPPPMTRFCVRNDGTTAAGFDIQLDGQQSRRLAGLEAAEEACLVGPYRDSTVTVAVDTANEIIESNEANNVETFTFFVPTATPPPLCTRTPTASPMPTDPPEPGCPGDCNGDRRVDVSEITTAVGISLGIRSLATCAAADRGDNGSVTIADLVAAVNAALHGC